VTTTRQSAIDIIGRSHHRREPEPLLDLIADDAEIVICELHDAGRITRMTHVVTWDD
jgi:hypothetical protein